MIREWSGRRARPTLCGYGIHADQKTGQKMSIRNAGFFSKFSLPGRWWLPDSNEQHGGTLDYRRDSILLTLHGDLSDRVEDMRGTFRPHPVVHGASSKGGDCTLFNVTPTNQSFWPSAPHTTYRVQSLVIGDHLLPGDLEHINYARVRFSNLEAWTGHRCIHYDDRFGGNEFAFEYRPSPEERFPLNSNGDSWTLRCDHRSVHEPNRLSITHRDVLTLQNGEGRSISEVMRMVQKMSYLLCLFTNEPTYPRSMFISTTVSDDSFDSAFLCTLKGNFEHKLVHAPEVLIPLRFIQSDLPGIFVNWFKEPDKLNAAKLLFFESLYSSWPVIDARFLFLAQAIETFARECLSDRLYLSKEEFSQIAGLVCSAIPEGIPEDLRERIQSQVSYANSLSLRTLIRELMSTLDAATVALICDSPKAFVDNVVRTRNELTHHSGRSPRPTGKELLYLSQRISMFLRIMFLKEIGLPEPFIRERICGNWQLKSEIGRYDSGG